MHDVNMKQDLKTQLLKLLHNPCLNEKVLKKVLVNVTK